MLHNIAKLVGFPDLRPQLYRVLHPCVAPRSPWISTSSVARQKQQEPNAQPRSGPRPQRDPPRHWHEALWGAPPHLQSGGVYVFAAV